MTWEEYISHAKATSTPEVVELIENAENRATAMSSVMQKQANGLKTKEIAKVYGVSSFTIKRINSRRFHVKPQTVKRVLKAIN